MPTDKILLVESNPRILEMLVDAFVRRLNCNITCVSTAEDALDVEMLEPHSIAVADTALSGMDAITLAARLCELGERPVILLGSNPTPAEVIEAMRCGVVDFFPKPFEIDALLSSVERAMTGHRQARAMAHRHRRMRALVRKVIRERRQLNERVELICRDLVGAHKRLAMRVLDQQSGVGVGPS